MSARMPWGKHAGTDLEDVPLSYLVWVLEACDNVRPALRREIQTVVGARLGLTRESAAGANGHGGGAGRWAPPPRQSPPAADVVEELVVTGRRALALKHHPDHGGSPTRMQALNAAVDWLLAAVGARR
jgi:Putative quorum-sensing-regulated virulence factor